jgi:hypothetical protein
MKFTISKKNDGLVFFLLFFFIFLNLSVIIFNNKINIINKFLYKDFKYFIGKKPIYYNYLNNKNHIIYNPKEPIIFQDLQEKINKFNKIQLPNGLQGWISSNKLKHNYDLYLYDKKMQKIIKIISIKKKDKNLIMNVLIFNKYINKKLTIIINKDNAKNFF